MVPNLPPLVLYIFWVVVGLQGLEDKTLGAMMLRSPTGRLN